MDELACAGQKWIRSKFRLKISRTNVSALVFVAAAEKFAWKDRKPSAGIGFGMGGGFEKLGYVATSPIQVDAATGNIAVNRIVTGLRMWRRRQFPTACAINVEGGQIMGIAACALRNRPI